MEKNNGSAIPQNSNEMKFYADVLDHKKVYESYLKKLQQNPNLMNLKSEFSRPLWFSNIIYLLDSDEALPFKAGLLIFENGKLMEHQVRYYHECSAAAWDEFQRYAEGYLEERYA